MLLRDVYGNQESTGIGLYHEGGPPTEVADKIAASFPVYSQKPMHQRMVVEIADKDRSVKISVSKYFDSLSQGSF